MENNQEGLIKWAINNFGHKLTIYEQKWDYFALQPYFDYRSVLNLNDQIYEGRGINSNQSLAITSSIGELLERYVIYNAGEKSSSGCAFHTSLDQAKINSRNELIERHFAMLFSLGYYTGDLIPKERLSKKIRNIVDELSEENIETLFYLLYSDSHTTVTLCQAYGENAKKQFGLVFGSSCKSTLNESLEASLKEILPNILANKNGTLQAINYSEFISKATKTPEDHLSLYLNRDFAEAYLKNRILRRNKMEQINYNNFTYKNIDSDLGHNFFIVKAFNPECINAQWGFIKEIEPENLNPLYPFILP